MTRELLEATAVSGDTWREAESQFTDRQAVEVAILAGYYSTLAMLIRGFQTPLPANAEIPEGWHDA